MHIFCAAFFSLALAGDEPRRIEGPDRLANPTWLHQSVRLQIRNEATGAQVSTVPTSIWSTTPSGLSWNLLFEGEGEPAGCEAVLELPILDARRQVFTPTERGVMEVSAYPDFQLVPYGSNGWDGGRCHVLPLISVMDPRSDDAATLALPPDGNIPHFQVEWSGGKTLRLRFGHRSMGSGRKAELKILLYSHAADFRSAIRAYSDDFPRYFRPGLPRGPHEGAFYYHHIQAHPEFEEMARQNVRFIWSSFWFTYLGEYLPAEKEWHPYTFARWWKLGETMSDKKIRSFAKEMLEHGIGTFAYFNLTEYGGGGGKEGGSTTAGRALAERFSGSLIRKESGEAIPTWEGAMAMNPGPGTPFFSHLMEEIENHLARLPEIQGFCVDRLDWASLIDYGHRDGLTMIGGREAENLAVPVARAMEEVCRRAHEAGKRIYANQFYRIEVLKDVDGYCHELDYPRGLGYLSPYRPASAWHQAKPYSGDLLELEGQLKRRLIFALQPQMIARRFPISQQAPSERAAELLETYAPLYGALDGKEWVLLPHPVQVTGANDVNLFVDRAGRYVAPVTSRVRSLFRGGGPAEAVTLRLDVPDGPELRWARILSADGPPCGAALSQKGSSVEISIPGHRTASVVIAGKGEGPPPDPGQAAKAGGKEPGAALDLQGLRAKAISLRGIHLEAPGKVWLNLDGKNLGEMGKTGGRFPLEPAPLDLSREPPVVGITAGDEGTWFFVERVDLLASAPDGRTYRAARWLPESGKVAGYERLHLRLLLERCAPEEIRPSTAAFLGKDAATSGAWKGKYGSKASWIPLGKDGTGESGFRLEVKEGNPFAWGDSTGDPRALERPACWFSDSKVELSIEPPDASPYRFSVYLLDFDRNGRVLEARISGEEGTLDARKASREETSAGIYFTWKVSGAIDLEVRKLEGYNAVVSGVFIDP